MDIADLKSLYLEELQELCDCHSQMAPALLAMAAAAGSAEVKTSIGQQMEMAVLHRRRLEIVLQQHCASPKPDIDKLATAFVRRAEHIMRSAPDQDLRDAALVSLLRRIGQYEVAGFATAEGYADTLYLGIDRQTLLVCMHEHKVSDERLAAMQTEANRLALLVSTPPY